MTSSKPPPFVATWLLCRLVPKNLQNEILGDLAETFDVYTDRFGSRYARRWYWRQLFDRDHFMLWAEALSWSKQKPTGKTPNRRFGMGLGLDLRYISRSLRREPVFVTTVVTTLALGIGACTAVFSLVHAVLLSPLPYASPDELALLWNRLDQVGVERAAIASADVLDFRERSETFSDFALANSTARASFVSGDQPWLVSHARVTPNLFSLLGVPPFAGSLFSRDLLVENGTVGLTLPMIVSHEFWLRALRGDTAAVGRVVTINGTPGHIMGITPPGFRLTLPPEAGIPSVIDVWTPTGLDATRGVRAAQRVRDQDSDDTGVVIGRLRRGATFGHAQAEMDALAAYHRRTHRWHRDVGAQIDVVPMHANIVASTRGSIVFLSAAVLAVLAIACMNIASLMLTRAVRRRKEFSARLALGASTGRIARLVLLESLFIACVGGVGGIVLARWGIDVLTAVKPNSVPLADNVGLNGVVVVFAIVTTVLTAMFFGLAPLVMRMTPSGRRLDLGHDASIAATGQSRARAVLVVTEVAASVALVITAGLLVRSFRHIQDIDPGFNDTNVITFDLTLRNPARHDGPAARTQFVRQLITELESVGGVQSASLVSRLPLDGRNWTNQFTTTTNGQPASGEANFLMISSQYFDVMSTPVLAGRVFDRSDDNQNIRVAIVDDVLANEIFPGTTAVGEYIDFSLDGDRVRAEIVGVVDGIRYTDVRVESRGTIYVPYRHEASRDVSIVVRTTSNPDALMTSVPSVVAALDPVTPVHNIRPLTDVVASSVASSVFLLAVVGVFAVVALVLSAIGLYGVIAYAVGLREREIGVRMALGARQSWVVRDVVWQGMRLVFAGLTAGVVVLLVSGRVVEQVLFGVRAADPITIVTTSFGVATLAFVACLVPAWRASRIGPASILRLD